MVGRRLHAGEFAKTLMDMNPIRPGPDWHERESSSLICLDLLLNQRVGVERATAVAVALHDHFARPLGNSSRLVSEATNWPYSQVSLRIPARSVFKVAEAHLDKQHWERIRMSELPSAAVGALASLERYYNRCNDFFDVVRRVNLRADQIRSLTVEMVRAIAWIKLPEGNLRQQLSSAAAMLEMCDLDGGATAALRKELKGLPRVGDELADTFLVYLFKRPALIIDEYLRRIASRHFVIEKHSCPSNRIRDLLLPSIHSQDNAHRLHARLNEIGMLFCHASQPDCHHCPLGKPI